MNRRDSLKIIGIATATATTGFIDACKPVAKPDRQVITDTTGRQPFEAERDKKLQEEKFFNSHEMATLAVLVDLIIPKDERSGSATDAKVPEFIEFIVKDEPQHQLPIRGGLKWLDIRCLNKYENEFKSCTPAQQTEMITSIAYPSLATPEMQPGIAFFSKIRDLTAIGFFTSKIGIEDLGYKGNTPTQWKGVPPEVLKQYGLQNV
jgi:gluconate 2-dehydrogenase gamma chain